MKHFKQNISLLAVSVFAISFLAVAPVFAIEGSDSGSGSSSSGSSSDVASTDDKDDDSPESVKDIQKEKEKRLEKAQKLLEQKRLKTKQKTVTARQKACENRKAAINKKYDTFSLVAARHLSKLDSTFVKLKNYHDVKKVQLATYDTLVAAATAKQTAATAQVESLKTASVAINCTVDDPANSVATLKTELQETRDTLKDYRKALKELMVALLKANGVSNSSDDNNQGSTN